MLTGVTHMEWEDLDPNCFIKTIIYVSVLNVTNIFVSWRNSIKCHRFYKPLIDPTDIHGQVSLMYNSR